MIEWFTENSFVPMVTGGLLTLAFLGFAFYFYDRTMLLIAILIAAITAGIVITEILIVTDKERLTLIVKDLAKSVEANDMDAILRRVSDAREDAKSRIRSEMPQIQFQSCRILKVLEFEIDDDRKKAKIVFVAFATGSQAQVGRGSVHRRVTLFFEKDANDQWRIYDYEHEPATAGYRL